MSVPLRHFYMTSALYDAISDGSGIELNPLEQETLSNVRAILNDPSQISSNIQPLPAIQMQLLKLMDNPDATYADLQT